VNINTATSEELQTLSGIGESKANKIITYRQQNGSFKTIDELCNVSGIGEKTLESLRQYICV
jgi:competence protein ComEA